MELLWTILMLWLFAAGLMLFAATSVGAVWLIIWGACRVLGIRLE